MFKDPIAIKKQDRPDKPKNGKPDVWNFAAPTYDQRHSCFINAGVDYGTGYRNPIGHKGDPKPEGVPRGVKKADADKY